MYGYTVLEKPCKYLSQLRQLEPLSLFFTLSSNLEKSKPTSQPINKQINKQASKQTNTPNKKTVS
jgi:hypothetical protein